MEFQDTFLKYIFNFFEQFHPILALKLAKIYNISKYIWYGYHKTKNLILMNSASNCCSICRKKCKKSHKYIGRKLLNTVINVKIFQFSITFSLITFFVLVFCNFSTDLKPVINSEFLDTHIAFLQKILGKGNMSNFYKLWGQPWTKRRKDRFFYKCVL